MGRVFEKRKHTMFARFDKMAKGFTKIGKEIGIAIKQGGADPGSNPRLRAAIQNAKAINMPKDRVDAAIKRASSKEEKDFEESIFEGYGPYGIAMLIECASDNNTRTVANIRMYFSRSNGALGTNGSVAFMFERKGVFTIDSTGKDIEELELDLIDFGLEEITKDEDGTFIYTDFVDMGRMQKALEEKGISIISTQKQRFPATTVELNEAQQAEINILIEKFEDDDDVQAVYHNMK